MAEERRPNRQYQQQEQVDGQQHQLHDKEQGLGDENPQSPTSKVARLSSDESDTAGAVTTAVASPLLFGFGLGVGDKAAKPAFTFMQMQEFHHQALIFKHMVAGIPVPIHLILPIWKSVAASYGPHHYPSFVGLGNLCYDFRNSMEPEPGRCRRTDGKKWRCSRDVVPDQKYCERHMHRGRNRSRKPVEEATVVVAASSVAPSPTAATVTNLSITIRDDDGLTKNNNNNNSSSSSNINMNSTNDVSTGRVGSSPTSVLSSSTACNTGPA